LCGYLSVAGAELVVSDLDANRCARAAATYGATVAAPEEIHAQHVDVFAPAAMVRIHLPPAVSQVRTCLSREFAFLRREAAVSAGVRAGASGAVGRDVRDAATSCQWAVISLSGYIPVPHRR